VRARLAHPPAPGRSAAAWATDLFEGVVVAFWHEIASAETPGIALVAQGGFGRREMAPYSDIDLMVLHAGRPRLAQRAAELARQLLQGLFDAGLEVGQSVRTPRLACRMAGEDATILTSLLDARLLAGDEGVFADLSRLLAGRIRRGRRSIAAVIAARREERHRFGETVWLLEPNVKRSPGALRDIQLVRWLGLLGWGTGDFDTLAAAGGISREDMSVLRSAEDFLMDVRWSLHLAAGRPGDELTRDEQVRIAAERGIPSDGGLLAVERFMRGWFGHTRRVARVARRLEDRLVPSRRVSRRIDRMLSRPVDGLFRVGPGSVWVPLRHVPAVAADLTNILRLQSLSVSTARPVERETWDAVLDAVRPENLVFSDAARGEFLQLFEPPLGGAVRDPDPKVGPGRALRQLHDAALLERVVPAFGHATGLMQFNNYHKYTVDEHCIHAVEQACSFRSSADWLGEVWHDLRRRRPVLIALLLHDLGKGFPEDHSLVGASIAREMAARLGLPPDESAIIEWLVAKHLLMSHLAFRRNAADESLVVGLAREVGSPERLRMLTVLTASDLAAVGPGTWNRWKSDLLGDLFHHTLATLGGESPSAEADRRREQVLALAAREPAVAGLALEAPRALLRSAPPETVHEELVRLIGLRRAAIAESDRLDPSGQCPDDASPSDKAQEVFVTAEWQPETATIAVTVGTHEAVAPGVFHRVTGGIASLGLEILSADIHTFGKGFVLDRFSVRDPDFSGRPPDSRLAEIDCAVRRWLGSTHRPFFPPRWGGRGGPPATTLPPQVKIDNESSAETTILEVFAHDSPGLLSSIARQLFEEGLSVRSAKIGTYLDQVVDGFHVTDAGGNKISDPSVLEGIRERLERHVAADDLPAAGSGQAQR
jgi:[protein-PII] uridylyltransferase